MTVGAKVGIIGDVHLGASANLGRQHPELNINTRLLDYSDTLEITIDEMISKGVSEIIFTGDIFEHRYPSLVQQKIFSQHLYRAISKGVNKIHIVVGNHDQQRIHITTTLSYLKELNLPNIIVHDEMAMATFDHFDKPIANLIFMPYRDRLWLGVESYEEAISLMRNQLESLMLRRQPDLPTILVGHMTIEGTFFDEGYRDLYSENQLTLPKDMFTGIDVTIMGHIHKPEIVSDTPYIAYVGSMEKRGGFESHDKVYAIVDVEDAVVDFIKEPCRDIFELNLDYGTLTLKDALMRKVFTDIQEFAKDNTLPRSVVKGVIRVSSEDEQYCDTKAIIQHLKEIHGVHFCGDIKREIYTPRQSRDERITENVTHTQAFQMFLENTVDDVELRGQLFEAGSEIIRTAGDIDASR